MNESSHREFEFGPFRYDCGQRLLFRGDEVVPLVPKALDTLIVLLERHGRVVEKAELMKLVWPDTVVEEVGLARNISILRKALGDESEDGGFIETIPKRGYRFSAEVREISPAAGVPSDAPPAPPRAGINRRRALLLSGLVLAALLVVIYWQFYAPSRYLPQNAGLAGLVVVPFECLSPNLGDAGFAEAFNEVLVAELVAGGKVQLISPGTVRRYRGLGIPMPLMARLLGVPLLLEGSAQQADGVVRITARLSDVHSGRLVWAGSFEQPAGPLVQIESEAARYIAREVGAQLSGRAKRATGRIWTD